MYAQGHGVEQNFVKAKELYEKACDLNNGTSFINLGILYEKGNGLAQNYTKAGELYQKACSLKYGLGCSNLGFLYQNGLGVKNILMLGAEFS